MLPPSRSTGLYSSGEVAAELGVSVRTIVNAVGRGELVPASNGVARDRQQQYRFTAEEVARFTRWYREHLTVKPREDRCGCRACRGACGRPPSRGKRLCWPCWSSGKRSGWTDCTSTRIRRATEAIAELDAEFGLTKEPK